MARKCVNFENSVASQTRFRFQKILKCLKLIWGPGDMIWEQSAGEAEERQRHFANPFFSVVRLLSMCFFESDHRGACSECSEK